MRQRHDSTNRKTGGRECGPARRWVTVLCAVPLVVGVGLIAYALSKPSPSPGARSSASAPLAAPATADAAPALGQAPREKVVGRWVRPDGGYVLEIRSVGADGAAQAAYFNPQPIHVAKAQVQSTGTAVAVYVELRDSGYPGNYYRLNYDAKGDRLVGTYDQPEARQQFDIYFERLK